MRAAVLILCLCLTVRGQRAVVPQWVKHVEKHCSEEHGSESFKSLTEAQAACLKTTPACGGVYDKICDGKAFYLCKHGAAIQSSSVRSCVYNLAIGHKECTCRNGVAAQTCVTEGCCEVCTKCNVGFALKNGHCSVKKCQCLHGFAAIGSSCPNEGQQYCEKCKAGFFLRRKEGKSFCSNVKQCTCKGGQASPSCPIEGLESCQRCYHGYYKLQSGYNRGNNHGYRYNNNNNNYYVYKCIAFKCSCVNGVGSVGPACPATGRKNCATCNAGFTLKKDKFSGTYLCAANQCTCSEPGAVGAKGVNCPKNGGKKCKCPYGYSFDKTQNRGNKCSANICTCKNGIPAVGTSCPMNGDEACFSCISGFSLKSTTGGSMLCLKGKGDVVVVHGRSLRANFVDNS